MATIKAVIPRSPPELEIRVETETSDLIFGHNSFDINACMSADATDDSEILPEGTTFWLDGQVLAQFNQPDMRPYQMRSSAFGRSAFHYQGMYAAKIVEGEHVARFRATDATGLSAETVRPFEFSLAPVIRDFKIMPGAVLKAGGPVFSAMVFDRGGDLDVTGLSVDINGEPVEANRLYYDPASGYFAVEGPLDFSDGRHTARLTAVDNQGNRVKASIQFIRRLQVVLTPGPEDDADMRIDTVSMMELSDHNGDGQANPGELIRLFIPLRNDSRQSVEQCRAVLVTGNEDISVETKDVLYGRIEPGAVVMPMKGFDLRSSREVLSGIVSDPHDIHFDLTVTCASENEWRLPLILPIYRPSVPVEISSAVNLTIDRLPPATNNAQIQLNGDVTSSGAFITAVVVRVNGTAVNPVAFNREGGRFEAAIPLEVGPNVIEVMATDQTGAQGYAVDNIQRAPIFKPPEIHIATPAENAFFQCGTLVVTGTYDSGSSDISHLTVKVPWSSKSGCPVTIIDNRNFTADCGPVIPIGGVYSIDVSIETIQGIQAQDTRGIIVGDCF